MENSGLKKFGSLKSLVLVMRDLLWFRDAESIGLNVLVSCASIFVKFLDAEFD